MRIWTHDSTVHRESFDLGINTFFPHLYPKVRLETVQPTVQRPLRARWNFHIPELGDRFDLRTTLEQTNGLLTRH